MVNLTFKRCMINSIKTYLEGLGMPIWGTIDKIKYEQGVLTICYCDNYIVIDKNNLSADGAIANEGRILATSDLRFALNILDSREDILKMIDDNVEFFEADFWNYTAHIKRYGEEEEVIEGVILED